MKNNNKEHPEFGVPYKSREYIDCDTPIVHKIPNPWILAQFWRHSLWMWLYEKRKVNEMADKKELKLVDCDTGCPHRYTTHSRRPTDGRGAGYIVEGELMIEPDCIDCKQNQITAALDEVGRLTTTVTNLKEDMAETSKQRNSLYRENTNLKNEAAKNNSLGQRITVFRGDTEHRYFGGICGGSFGEILCYELHSQLNNPRAPEKGLTFKELASKWEISVDFLGALIADHCNKL